MIIGILFTNVQTPNVQTLSIQIPKAQALNAQQPSIQEQSTQVPSTQTINAQVLGAQALSKNNNRNITGLSSRGSNSSRINAQKNDRSNEKAIKINKVLGGVLKNKGNNIVKLSEKYNIDPYIATAIMIHETANGRSCAVVNQNNAGGLTDNNGKITTKDSLDEGIEATIKNLKVNYIDCGLESIKAIQPKYAPIGAKNDPEGLNKDWLPLVQYYYELIENK